MEIVKCIYLTIITQKFFTFRAEESYIKTYLISPLAPSKSWPCRNDQHH